MRLSGFMIRKYMPFQPNNSGMTPNGKIYVAGVYRADYGASSPNLQSFFIHEMVHVYQYQLKILKPFHAAIGEIVKHGFNYDKAYKYTLDSQKDFLDYGLEQQAQIVEDYFRLYKLGLPPVPGYLQNKLIDVHRKDLYLKVLAKFFSNPNYARHERKCKRVNKGKNRSIKCKTVLSSGVK